MSMTRSVVLAIVGGPTGDVSPDPDGHAPGRPMEKRKEHR